MADHNKDLSSGSAENVTPEVAEAEDAVATCGTCGETITYATRVEPGFLPRTGWRDRFRDDPLVCFSASNLTHTPTVDETAPISRG